MPIRDHIIHITRGSDLTQEQAAEAMEEMMTGLATPAQIAAFLTALHLKGETEAEIAGMAQVMREKATHVFHDGPVLDTCGTGGDSSGTFNISTTTAFVAAGAGATVAKHGNRAASSACGPPQRAGSRGQRGDDTGGAGRRLSTDAGAADSRAASLHRTSRGTMAQR